MLICPGNHDLKYLGAAGFVGDNRKQFNQKLKQLIPSESIWYGTDLDSYPIIHKIESTFFIGLDSLEDEKDLAADGELGVTQLSILDDKLTEIRSNYQGSQIIVYLHHQPFEIMLGEFWMKLKDRKRFMEIINGVDCLLFGHVHIQKRFELEEKLHHIKCIHLSGATLDNEYGIIVTEIDTKDFNINYTVVPVPEKDKD